MSPTKKRLPQERVDQLLTSLVAVACELERAREAEAMLMVVCKRALELVFPHRRSDPLFIAGVLEDIEKAVRKVEGHEARKF